MLQKISKRQMLLVSILTAIALVTSFSWNAQGKFEIPQTSAAQSDYFLKLEGVDGESTDASHRGEIEINSWSWGASNPGISHGSGGKGGGGGAGKASFSDISFTTSVGKATPKLMLLCATGEHIKSAKLFVRKAGSTQDYYTIELKEVMVSSYQVAGDGNEETTTFSLSFQKIEMEYIPQNPDGTTGEAIKAGWDLAKNKKI